MKPAGLHTGMHRYYSDDRDRPKRHAKRWGHRAARQVSRALEAEWVPYTEQDHRWERYEEMLGYDSFYDPEDNEHWVIYQLTH